MKPQHIILVVGLWLLLASRPAEAVAQSADARRDAPAALVELETALVDVIGRVEPSVVAISRAAASETPLAAQGLGDAFGEFRQAGPNEGDAPIVGAGVIIDRSGLVLTQYLAVREGEVHTITTVDGKRYPATTRGADPRSGLAVLKIDPSARRQERPSSSADSSGSFPAIRFGDASALRKGQVVLAIGNPYAIASDGQPTASWGIVSNLARKAPSGTNFNDAPGPNHDHRTSVHHLGTLIQTDAKLGWSAGGAALVNLRGELIGLTTTAATIAGHEQPAGYAIPLNTLMRRVIDALKHGREVEYGMLGVGFSPAIVGPDVASRPRLNVAQVYPGSPAERAGMQAGDVITRIGEVAVADIDAVQLAISALEPATTTTIEYERRGRRATATVAVAKLAVAGHKIVSNRPEAWHGIRVDYATALDAAALEQATASGALDADGCVRVTEVEPGSDGWRAGVRAGMFISHVGGQRIATPQEFRAAAKNVGGDRFEIRLTQPAAADDQEGAPRQEKPQ